MREKVWSYKKFLVNRKKVNRKTIIMHNIDKDGEFTPEMLGKIPNYVKVYVGKYKLTKIKGNEILLPMPIVCIHNGKWEVNYQAYDKDFFMNFPEENKKAFELFRDTIDSCITMSKIEEIEEIEETELC